MTSVLARLSLSAGCSPVRQNRLFPEGDIVHFAAEIAGVRAKNRITWSRHERDIAGLMKQAGKMLNAALEPMEWTTCVSGSMPPTPQTFCIQRAAACLKDWPVVRRNRGSPDRGRPWRRFDAARECHFVRLADAHVDQFVAGLPASAARLARLFSNL